jgi:hypothetical protein
VISQSPPAHSSVKLEGTTVVLTFGPQS